MFQKKTLLILVIAVFVLGLVACAGAGTEVPVAEEEAEEEAEPMEEESEEESTEPAEEESEEEESGDQDMAGASLYQENCAGCHGNERNGGRGPALLPDTLTEDSAFYNEVITDGLGGMPAFGNRLSSEEIESLVEFILSEPN